VAKQLQHIPMPSRIEDRNPPEDVFDPYAPEWPVPDIQVSQINFGTPGSYLASDTAYELVCAYPVVSIEYRALTSVPEGD
jgi:hypothetical protein